MVTTNSLAEQKAKEAMALSKFKGVNLQNVKESLAKMLEHITDQGMFDQYTKHDISHIDGMLNLVNDIIPQSVISAMTPTDWLMIVLSIYFHDLGMLITHQEFNDKDNNHDYRDYLLKFRK